MSINRRKFLQTSTTLGAGLVGGASQWSAKKSQAEFHIPQDFKLTILATNWGFPGNYDEFCAKAKTDGYDGIEVWLPGQEERRKELLAAVEKHGLQYGFLAGGNGNRADEHLAQFKENVEAALEHRPLFINCHSGRDYFTFAENRAFIDFTTKKTAQTGIPIYHETHRSRMLFAAHVTKKFIEEIPDLRLTLDISHWTNVHESLLADQKETIDLALSRVDHIHSRIGHQESPQITDPRAPEWEAAVSAHFAWWDAVVKYKIDQDQPLTMTTEFGPPNYMAMVPFTRQPLADLWGVNKYMMELWRERYGVGGQ